MIVPVCSSPSPNENTEAGKGRKRWLDLLGGHL